MFFVYMIKNESGRLYIGISENTESRLRTHNLKRGAQFTKNGNFKLVFTEEYQTLREARSREIQIKKWRREKKEMLIQRYEEGLPTRPVLKL